MTLSPQGSGSRVDWVAEVKQLGGLLKAVPQGDFEAPSEKIVWVNVDGDTGKRATADTRQPVLEAYLKGSEPPDETGAIATAPGQPQQAPNAAQAADQVLKGGL